MSCNQSFAVYVCMSAEVRMMNIVVWGFCGHIINLVAFILNNYGGAPHDAFVCRHFDSLFRGTLRVQEGPM